MRKLIILILVMIISSLLLGYDSAKWMVDENGKGIGFLDDNKVTESELLTADLSNLRICGSHFDPPNLVYVVCCSGGTNCRTGIEAYIALYSLWLQNN